MRFLYIIIPDNENAKTDWEIINNEYIDIGENKLRLVQH